MINPVITGIEHLGLNLVGDLCRAAHHHATAFISAGIAWRSVSSIICVSNQAGLEASRRVAASRAC